jgi:DNA invertase Pin-like site-specific DNA recombinase
MQRDAIERRGVPVAKWYAEKASAKTTKRTELQRLLADVRAGLPDLGDHGERIGDSRAREPIEFEDPDVGDQAGATLHLVADNVTIKPGDDVVSDVMIFALGLAAGLERTAINDRIAAARTRQEAAGLPWGRPARMTVAEQATAKRMAKEGRTVREISAALGVPRSTVGRSVAA